MAWHIGAWPGTITASGGIIKAATLVVKTSVVAEHPNRLAVHHTSRTSSDFVGPRDFDFGGIPCSCLVEADQKFGGHIGSFFDGQRQGFSKKFLRSGRHVAILGRLALRAECVRELALLLSCAGTPR